MDEGKVTIYICTWAKYKLRVTCKAFTLHSVNAKINFAAIENIATGVIIFLALTNNGKVDKTNSNLGALYIQDKEHEKLLI